MALHRFVAAVVIGWCALAGAQTRPLDVSDDSRSSEEMRSTDARDIFWRPPTRVSAEALSDANAQAARAYQQVQQAESAINVIPLQLREAFESSPEYLAAQRSLHESQEAYSAARAAAIKRIADDARYRDAQAEQERIGRILEAGNLTPKDRTALATRKMESGAAASRIEAESLRNDPAARQAQQRLAAAGAKVIELRARFDDSVRTNPQFVSARQTLERARADHAAADAQVAALADAYDRSWEAYYYNTRRNPYRYYYTGWGWRYPYYNYGYSYYPYTITRW